MFHPLRRATAAFLAAAAIVPAAFAGNQLVVGPPGTAPFSQIEAAVQAASDGDIILVKPGTYGPFYLADKSISIIAVSGIGSVTVTAGSRVVFLSAGKTVVLSNLRLQGGTSSFLLANRGLCVLSNAGAVRIEDCEIIGGAQPVAGCTGFGDGSGWPALWVADSSDVAVVGGTLQGGQGKFLEPEPCLFVWYGKPGGAGLFAERSNVVLQNVTSRGGQGASAPAGGKGGPGVLNVDGFVLLSRSTARGGTGGVSNDLFPGLGAGGPGLVSNAPWVSQGATLIGGGGQGPGASLEGPAPTVWTDHGRWFGATHFAWAGQPLGVTLLGEVGDLGFLLLGFTSLQLPLEAFAGVLFVAPFELLTLGVVPAGGEPTGANFTVPPLPPGSGMRVMLQGAALSSAGEFWLANARYAALTGSPP